MPKKYFMYVKGMTTRQISKNIEDIYGFEVSEEMVSDITDKLLPYLKHINNRLGFVNVFIFFPSIYITYHV